MPRMHAPHLVEAIRSLWTGDYASQRRRTLARLAMHERQLETWWRCELGAHLWDHIHQFGDNVDVWLEALDRADITVATATESPNRAGIHRDGAVCIPIELKTCGTWWGKSKSAIAKALDEDGKKRLSQDLRDLHERRRPTRPFGAVGLLVTHVGRASDQVLLDYLDFARQLGRRYELEVLLDEPIELPAQGGASVTAHQIFWTTPAVADEENADERNRRSDASPPGSPSRVYDAITEHQRAWMRTKAPSTTSRDWMRVLDDNLFEPLDPAAREELEAADGNELGGKLTAPWSSSALALNVFHFWRHNDATLLARVLQRSKVSNIRFEACHPTGNRHARANLDVEIHSDGEPVLAIESKFREPFGHHAPLLSSYLDRPDLWQQLPRCLAIANSCERDPNSYQRLDVAQLLKHILGLTRSYGRGFELLYLWYDPTQLLGEHERGPVVQHMHELDRFGSELGDEVRFRHMSYQVLLHELRDANADYVQYLRKRYLEKRGR